MSGSPAWRFGWRVRVYYEDTDVGGVVYHANYLKFMERARTEWLRELGHDQDALIRNENLVFAVQSVSIRFLRPARYNDLLRVDVGVARLGRVSIDFTQAVSSIGDGETVLSEATVRVASLDTMSFRPKPLPRKLYEDLERAG